MTGRFKALLLAVLGTWIPILNTIYDVKCVFNKGLSNKNNILSTKVINIH